MGRLDGKVAIVTGASSGIGKGIARAFDREGAKVALAARSAPALEAAVAEIRQAGGTALAFPTDITNEADVAALFQKTLQAFGRLDILVNNAAIFEGAPLDELSLQSWRRVIDTDLTGPFLCTREAMRVMKRQRSGRIINIGSIAAQMPRPGAAPYSCAKIALVALTKTTALEGREFGITAGIVHPGNTDTPQMAGSEHEPMMAVEDLVPAVVTMAAMPPHVNMLETIVMPAIQPYLGRG
jgi:NAD(P)-dependent dehydrogenase (short-subunit alcohol dehydrogenase family)